MTNPAETLADFLEVSGLLDPVVAVLARRGRLRDAVSSARERRDRTWGDEEKDPESLDRTGTDGDGESSFVNQEAAELVEAILTSKQPKGSRRKSVADSSDS